MKKETQDSSKTKKQRIIIADDDLIYRKSLGVALKRNYDIDYASNANELIEMALKENYSLLLTDNQMEDGHGDSGFYAAKKIREKNKKIPIIMNTARFSEEIEKKAKNVGINKILKKPIVILDLIETIEDCLKSQEK